MNFPKIIVYAGLTIGLAFSGVSCKKSFLDTKPSDQVIAQDVFKTVQGARSVINGMHRRLFDADDTQLFGMPSINLMYELMSEDLGMAKIGSGWFVSAARYSDARNPSDNGSYQWTVYYAIVNNANFIIANIDGAVGDESEKTEIKAQAYAYRAWAYLQLIQCYQYPYNSIDSRYIVSTGGRTGEAAVSTIENALGVPLYTEPTKEGNPRATMREVYNQINSDLDQAISLFESGVPGRSDKSQININVAKGIYARAALVQQNWTTAATMAKEAREGYTLMAGSELVNGFNNVNNKEWIWGSVINAEQNGIYASWLSHMDPGLQAYGLWAQKQINNKLFLSIPSTDARKQWFVPRTVPIEYKEKGYTALTQLKFYAQTQNSFVSDYPLMRAAEMYLIEAEADAQANLTSDALQVLQEFGVTRDPDYTTAAFTTKDNIVQEIWRQRRVELWGEGFRFFDAKRQMAKFQSVTSLDAIDKTFSVFNMGVYGSTVQRLGFDSPLLNFRIPSSELDQNKECIQNP